ncbi:Exosome component 10, partial [Tyrophagus putrescentiae]
GEKSTDSGSNAMSSFTTKDYLDKIRDTLMIAQKIKSNPASKKNSSVKNLLNLQSSNTLQLLSRINDRNPLSKDFKRPNLSDSEKFALLSEINDSIVDKTIHFTERVRHIKEGKSDLIEVSAKISSNSSRIEIKDYKSSGGSTPVSSNLVSGMKRKSVGTSSGEPPAKKSFSFLAASNIPRPQNVYRAMTVDNAYSTPFIPKLTRKPNATVPLEESLKPIAFQNFPNVTNTKDQQLNFSIPTHFYPHPYQKELEEFEPKIEFFEEKMDVDELPPMVGEMKPIKFISRKEQLQELVTILKKYKEIAVDVEHHSFRTYQGFTCLIQISTSDDDYVIDVFPLWSDMELLNEVFTDPAILKVFHGADFDIIWLQRDLGIYVVNMFDTGLAAKMLNYNHLSLSYLVSKFIDYSMDKRYQLADWRMRPIPEEMLNYARFDTRFLLYIYRAMKAELLEKGDGTANLLRVVMDKSREMCLKRYEKKYLEPDDHLALLWKNNLKFNSRQLAALKELYVWRDYLARNEDESTGYVLPNNLLLKICEILPREKQGILALLNPIPPLVRQCINEIHKIILEARSRALDENDQENRQKNWTTVKGVNNSIDLTVDRRIDEAHQGADHSHVVGQVPLLNWNSEKGKFEFSSVNGTANNKEKDKGSQVKSASGRWTLSDMFIDNVAMFIKKEAEVRQRKNKVDQLFADYVSPYQNYIKSLERKKQLEAAEAK